MFFFIFILIIILTFLIISSLVHTGLLVEKTFGYAGRVDSYPALEVA
jgi:hypothetical protein